VLHQVVLAFEEILAEIRLEVVEEPLRLILEFVQFALLIVIVWVVAVGFGKRRGFVVNMLSERSERVSGEIEVASHAAENLALAQNTAREQVESADAAARQLLDTARADAEQIESTARTEADAEARRITERAESALATETEEMQLELREELVSIVAQATRSILNEKMSVSEQRALIESSILASIGPEDESKVSDNGSSRRRSKSAPRSGTAS